jgi:zinc protease
MTRLITVALVTLLTAAGARAQAPADPNAWRAKQPAPSGVVRFASPKVTKLKLKSGIPVWLVERHELPLVTVLVAVRAGAELATAEKAGLPHLVNRMLLEGTTTRNAIAIAEEVDALGARLHRFTGQDASLVALDALTEALDPSLDLLADVVLRPAFAPKELERVRSELIADLQQLRDEPPQLSMQLFETVLYGTQHPYGLSIRGTEGSLKRITSEDVSTFYRARYVAPNATILAVGDVEPKALLARLEARFGTWPAGARPAPVALPKAAPPRGVTFYLVDRPGAPQAQVRFGTLGLARRDASYPLAVLANEVFGGSFGSRLNMNLREKQGYTYGARAFIVGRRTPGPFSGGGGIKSAATPAAIREILDELDGMRTRPPTGAELESARNRLLLSLAGRFETNSHVAGTLQELMNHGLPPNYYDTLGAKLVRFTPPDISRFAPRLFDPRHVVFGVVGSQKELEPELAKLGKVTIVDEAEWRRLFP